jgi:nucleosome assembly protein 1-like 1
MSDSEEQQQPPNNGALLDDASTSVEEDNSPMNSLPVHVIPRVAKLQSLDDEREKIMEEYMVERAALEQKYASRFQPLYETRAKIIKGDMDDEISKEQQAESTDTERKDQDENSQEKKEAGIPQFWIVAMTQMETIAELISEEDVDCLDSLLNITCEDDEDGKGFTLSFHFAPNDYFYDSVLTKRYSIPNLLASDEPLLKHVEGCKIQWKEDMCLTSRKVTKKQRGKGKNAGQIRTVVKTEDKESFFQWFDPPQMPSMEEMDEEEAQRLEEMFDADYEVAQAFRTQMVPRAVMWFSGEAAERDLVEAISDALTNDSEDQE